MDCTTPTPTPTPSPWTGLLPDLLLDVSSHMQHTADLVRFHAVCRSWRFAALPPHVPVVGSHYMHRPNVALVDSRRSHEASSHDEDIVLVEPPEVLSHFRNWVASADRTAAWIFVACPDPRLIDIRTGAATHLPPLPGEMSKSRKNVCGAVYGDDTIFLYKHIRALPNISYTMIFPMAILHPNDVAWMVMEKRLKLSGRPHCMYHDGWS
ncbi:hypothetical protein ZWY2020_023136 [Hordeum vulgare]|nr:hypothetical protein ZWY2020_023136 [Hordeum vulgare]